MGVLVANLCPEGGIGVCWIFGAINETDDCSAFEVTEAVGLINDRREFLEGQAVLLGYFVDHGLALCANMKEEISIFANAFGHGNGRIVLIGQSGEFLKFLRPGCTREEVVPALTTHSQRNAQVIILGSDIHRTVDRLAAIGEVAEGLQFCGLILAIEPQVNEKDALAGIFVHVLGMS